MRDLVALLRACMQPQNCLSLSGAGKHTIFGRVHTGMEVVERIGSTATGAQDRPMQDIRIIRATILERGLFE